MSGRFDARPNVDRPDDVFEALLALHEGLSDRDSALLNARLVLCLINHIGDEAVIREALAMAAAPGPTSRTRPAAAAEPEGDPR
jgi:3-(3-hydroxy-phenyl)propionate hydroxylase